MKYSNIYRFLLLWTGILLRVSIRLYAQQPLPPGQPEQDACNAIKLCGGRFTTPYSYSGFGIQKEAYQGSPAFGGNCHEENNSVWFRLDVATAGAIVFTITPLNPLDDYDFTIWNGGSFDCHLIGSYNYFRTRCQGNVSDSVTGVIGLNYTSTLTRVEGGTQGNSFLQYIDAVPDEVYYIMVDNYTGSAIGFTIDFAGSTATFKSIGPPIYQSVVKDCVTEKGLTIHMDKPVACNSIAADGSDFHFSRPDLGSIVSAAGKNCTADGYTRDILVAFSNVLPPDTYTINAQQGTDGNTLLSVCGDLQVPGNQLTFFYQEPIRLQADKDTLTCIGQQLGLHAAVSGGYQNKVQWQPAAWLNKPNDLQPLASPLRDTAFIVTISDANAACTVKDTVKVVVLQGFHLLNTDTVICQGNVVNLDAVGDSRYVYEWTPVTDLSGNLPLHRITQPAVDRVYTLKASRAGCRDSMQSVTIGVEPVPVVNIGTDTVYCNNTTWYPYATVLPQSYRQYRYNWQPAAMLEQATTAHPLFTGKATIDLSLTVSTPHGCKGEAVRQVRVYFPPQAAAGPDIFTAAGKAVVIHGSVEGEAIAVEWSPSLYLSNTKVLMPIVTPLADQQYYFTATGPGHCSTTDSMLVKIYNEIDVPNVFTPNGDGIHDKWVIGHLQDYSLAVVNVFDRWGRLVYHAVGSTAAVGWDGTSNGTPVPAGTYYYIVLPGANGYGKVSGSVMVIR